VGSIVDPVEPSVGEEGGVFELLQLQMRSLPVSWTQQLISLTRLMESEDRYMHPLLSPFLYIPRL
jgi:hypothetical protein